MLRYNRDDDTTCGSLAASSFPARVSNKASLFCTTLAMSHVRFWLLRPQQFWWPLSQPHCTQWPSTAAPATCCIGRGARVAYLYEFHATLFIAPVQFLIQCYALIRFEDPDWKCTCFVWLQQTGLTCCCDIWKFAGTLATNTAGHLRSTWHWDVIGGSYWGLGCSQGFGVGWIW